MSSFSSLLQAEINNKKRKAEEEAPSSRPGKYVRKGDLMKQKQEQQNQERLEKQKQELEKRRKEEEQERKEKEEKVKKEEETTLSWEEEKLLQIPFEEVKKGLRALKVPITFFGETDLERAKRLHALEKLQETDIDKGQRHDFGKILASLNDEQADDSVKKKSKENDVVWAQMVPGCSEEVCLFWIRQMLQEWERELDLRSEEEKRQKQGKIKTAEYHQTYQYIRPMLRKLKKKTLSDDLLAHVTQIVTMCKEREYVKANDAYFEMAIGNAAWPIGVTMVGIHERSAREKISSNKTAHVLNDEVQRKYIQSLKRLMTFCQEKYKANPSKCVR